MPNEKYVLTTPKFVRDDLSDRMENYLISNSIEDLKVGLENFMNLYSNDLTYNKV